MKRLLIIVMALAVVGMADAQKKPKINQAEKARTDGNLTEAVEIIEAATQHEKTKDDGKTWYYRGLIYATLDTTSNEEFQSIVDNPLEIAMESFAKADEIDPEGSKYYISDANGFPVLKEQQISTLANYYLNLGVENYQGEKLDDAVTYFSKVQTILPKDTTGYLYAGLAAQQAEKFDVAADNYYKLVELDYNSPDIYNSLIYIESSVNKDNEKALEIIRMAREKFPETKEFARAEITLLIQMEKADDALAELDKEIQNDLQNAELHYFKGLIHDEKGEFEKARDAYKMATEADPTYYDAAYNLAALMYNEAVDLIKERGNLGISQADQKKAREMTSEIEEKLKASLPHWKKALEIKPNDRTALETLQYIYSQLKMMDELEAIQAKLETLDEGE